MIIKEKLTEDQYNSLVNCMNEKEKYEYHNKGILPECFTKQSFFLDFDNNKRDPNLIEITYEYNKRSKKDILIDIKQDNDLYVKYYDVKLDIQEQKKHSQFFNQF